MKTLLRRFLFTILMLFLFGIVGILTNTYVAAISNHWLDRLGFAPIDLLALDLFRLFTSALVTAGGPVFWEILRLTAFGVGLSEWLTGTRRAALTFWGIHSTTLVLELLVCALPLQSIGMKFGSLVALSRDVGPSAGYFGALGLVSAHICYPWNLLSGGVIFIALEIVLLHVSGGDSLGMEVSADLAHLITFPLGWFSNRLLIKNEQNTTT